MRVDPFEILKNFDTLPDDAVASPRVTAIMLGVSERTLRRGALIPRIELSARRIGYRVGAIRRHVRGEVAA